MAVYPAQETRRHRGRRSWLPALLVLASSTHAQSESSSEATASSRLAEVAQFNTVAPFIDRGLDLSGKNLSSGNWRRADVAYSNFRSADLSRADFSYANLAKSDFSQANLSQAQFVGANLSRSGFADADLSHADLSETNLLGSVFRGSDLANATLTGATLSFADLRGAIGVTPEQIVQAQWSMANPPRMDDALQERVRRLGRLLAKSESKAARTVSPAIERQLQQLLVVDGTASYGRRKDTDCERRCTTEAVPFAELNRLTGVDIGMFTVSRSMRNVDRVAALVESDPAALLIRNRRDLAQARATGRLGVIIYSQQVPLLHGDARSSLSWFDHGVRVVQPAYSRNLPVFHLRKTNKLGGGADEPGVGLTGLGRSVVRQLVEQGMIIDVSHCSEATTMDILAMTSGPVMANHANAKALTVAMRGPTPLGRNKSDKELQAIAARGGVIGVTTVGWMLDRNADTSADLDDFLAHIDYMVNLLGVEHVGIASDSGIDGWGTGEVHYADANLSSPKRWSIVLQALQQRGYSQEDISRIMGLNFYEFLAENLPR